MKLLPFSGLISVILLASLFLYVVEDIPSFGDPNSPANKYTELFRVAEEDLGSSLDGGVVPAEIEDKIRQLGYSREYNFPALDEGKYEIEWNEAEDGWDIFVMKDEMFYPGPERFYLIKKEDGMLNVYRYSLRLRWIEKTEEETALPNMVTSGLADYRGYDTLFEETVIFTAAVSVALLLRRRGAL